MTKITFDPSNEKDRKEVAAILDSDIFEWEKGTAGAKLQEQEEVAKESNVVVTDTTIEKRCAVIDDPEDEEHNQIWHGERVERSTKTYSGVEIDYRMGDEGDESYEKWSSLGRRHYRVRNDLDDPEFIGEAIDNGFLKRNKKYAVTTRPIRPGSNQRHIVRISKNILPTWRGK